jgi:hypothetical protein
MIQRETVERELIDGEEGESVVVWAESRPPQILHVILQQGLSATLL